MREKGRLPKFTTQSIVLQSTKRNAFHLFGEMSFSSSQGGQELGCRYARHCGAPAYERNQPGLLMSAESAAAISAGLGYLQRKPFTCLLFITMYTKWPGIIV